MKKQIRLKNLVLILILNFIWISSIAQTVTLVNNGNLVLSSGGSMVVDGNLLNKANGNDAIANSGEIILKGNFTNNATSGNLLTGTSGKVILNGSSQQTIGGSRSTYFTNLKLDNAAGFTIDKEIFVEDTLELINGIVSTASGKELSFTSTANYTGGSDTAYVDGPMKRTGTSAFIYPVGDSGHIAQLGLSALTASNTFTVSYSFGTPPDYTNYSGPNIHDVSSVESWEVTPASGTPQTNMTLYYNSGSRSGISDPSLLMGAHYNGSSSWNEVAHQGHTGNATSGSLTFGPVNSYSKFTFGSSDNVTNPLPVEMLYFKVFALQTSIGLNWATASEINSDVFEIQRSTNAKDFETIATLKAAGNSNSLLKYDYEDKNVVFNQDYYYRLKQIDFDGKYEYTEIRTARLNDNNEIFISIFPNPTKDYILIKSNIEEDVSIDLYDVNGKQLINKTHIKADLIKLPIHNLASGIYFLRIKGANKLYKTHRIRKI